MVLRRLANQWRETFTTEEAARRWLHAPSLYYLGGLTPADALRVGRIDRAAAGLEALDSGVSSKSAIPPHSRSTVRGTLTGSAPL